MNYIESASHVQTIKCGVPQGLVLGPLFYHIHQRYSWMCPPKSILYADDNTIYLSHNNLAYLTLIYTQQLMTNSSNLLTGLEPMH